MTEPDLTELDFDNLFILPTDSKNQPPSGENIPYIQFKPLYDMWFRYNEKGKTVTNGGASQQVFSFYDWQPMSLHLLRELIQYCFKHRLQLTVFGIQADDIGEAALKPELRHPIKSFSFSTMGRIGFNHSERAEKIKQMIDVIFTLKPEPEKICDLLETTTSIDINYGLC